jgi:peroxiredoxin
MFSNWPPILRIHIALLALLLISSSFSAESTIEVRAADGSIRKPFTEIGTTGAKCAVFFFYLHDCPICNAYAPEIQRICTDFAAKGFTFYIVQTDPALNADVAQKHAKDYAISCPVLLDDSNKLARKCGATITPQAAIVNSDGVVVYMGRIDDLYADFGKRKSAANVHDLRDALTAIADGRTVPAAKGVAVGCFISFSKRDEGRKP